MSSVALINSDLGFAQAMQVSTPNLRQLQSYALWLEERGLFYFPLLQQAPASVVASPQSPFAVRGPRPAKLLVIFADPALNLAGPLNEAEKTMLRRLLQAMGLDLKTEVCFGQKKDGGDYGKVVLERALRELVKEVGPRAIMILGEEPSLASSAKYTWCYPELLGGEVPVMPMFHPRDIVNDSTLKRLTWGAALQVREIIHIQ